MHLLRDVSRKSTDGIGVIGGTNQLSSAPALGRTLPSIAVAMCVASATTQSGSLGHPLEGRTSSLSLASPRCGPRLSLCRSNK